MLSPSKDFADHINAAGISGVGYGTRNLFYSRLPDEPSLAVAVYDNGGEPAEAGYDYERPYVLVRVRGENENDYNSTYALAAQIKGIVLEPFTENTSRYIGVWLFSDVRVEGYDTDNRPVVSFELRAHRTEG